jgi:predicted transcriptional regulator
MPEKTTTVSVKLPDPMLVKLDKLAKKRDRSRAAEIRVAILATR